MKQVFLIISFLIITWQGYSQGNAIISGRVIEQSTNDPIPFANVTLSSDKSDEMLTGTITENDGRFVINGVTEGNYTITVSFIGYETKQLPILIGKLNEIFDVGRIELQTSSENLDEVVITKKREIVSSGLDKKSFNIENNISQAGGSVMDAMRNLPGVSIDPEGKILLRGSDKVTVLISKGIGKHSGLKY